MEKECTYCHKAFDVQRTDSVYCSRSCRQMAYMERKMDRLKTAKLQGIGEGEKTVVGTVETINEADLESPPVISNQSKAEMPVKLVEEYVPATSHFLDRLRRRVDDDSNLSALNSCISVYDDLHSYWVALRLRCLLECLLLFSEAKLTKVADLMEVCNAFTLVLRSAHYQKLPDLFPYCETICSLREKLKRLCIKAQKTEQIKFRLEQNDKIELMALRYELAQFIPKIKFSQLDFR